MALVSVATSLVPVMLTVTVAEPPSVVATLKTSVTTWPALSSLSAELVV